MRKWISLCMALVMLLCSVSAFANEVDPANVVNEDAYQLFLAAEDNTMPICSDGSITLTIYVDLDEYSVNFMDSYDEHPVVKEVERLTGINIEFVHPPVGDDGTFFTQTLASGEYPDIFLTSDFAERYPGGVAGAINDGVLIDMDPYIRQYAKNFLALLSQTSADTYRNMTDDEGRISMGSSFACDFIRGKVNQGFVCRLDLLQAAGIESVPTTIDELTEALRALKAYGVEIPMSLGTLDNYRYTDSNFLSAAFGVAMNAYQVDENGTVFYSRAAEGYKAFLKQMNAWYEEGLIDRDLVTRNVKDCPKQMYNGTTAFCVVGNWQTAEMVVLGTETDPNFVLAAVPNVRLTDASEHQGLSSIITEGEDGQYMHISATCKYPEAAVKLLDYLYNMDTVMLAYWGVGEVTDENGTVIGTTYNTLEDGSHEYGDLIMADPDWDYETIRHKYTLQIFQRYMIEEPERLEYSDPICQECWDVWTANTDNTSLVANSVTRTADEDAVFSLAQNDINTYSDEMMYYFILGEKDIDAEWDSYIATMEAYGLRDCEAIQQAAYDRWATR